MEWFYELCDYLGKAISTRNSFIDGWMDGYVVLFCPVRCYSLEDSKDMNYKNEY